MTKRRSLRLELIATLAIVLMMAVVSLLLATEMLGARRHVTQELERLEDHSRSLAAVITPLLGPGSAGAAQRSEVEQVLRPSVGTLGIVEIEVYRMQEPKPQSVVALGLAPDLPPPEAADGKARPDLLDERGIIVIDQPIRTFGPSATRDGLVLRLVARPSPWKRLGDWRDILIVSLGVGVVLLVLGGMLVEHQVLRPLREVRAAATQVALGNLDAQVPDAGPAELQSLADSFNQMTRALSEKLQEIAAQREQLVRAEQLASVGRISAGVAHEVGNPLAAILGYVELLLDPRDAQKLSDEQREMLERTRDQIQRIQTIVRQLLEYSTPKRQEVEPIDLVKISENLVGLLRHDPRAEHVELRVVATEPVVALANDALVEQILQNLVTNACRAAAGGEGKPKVELRLRRDAEGKSAIVEIQDTGPGVEETTRPHLFEPFFTTAEPGKGTGLGLAISKGLVESMSGDLECLPPASRPPLEDGGADGAVFRLRLPLEPSEGG